MNVMVRPFADCSVLIVGGTSGVGMATAIQLVDSGVRRIALVGRNAERGEQARQRVLAAAPDAKVMFVQGMPTVSIKRSASSPRHTRAWAVSIRW